MHQITDHYPTRTGDSESILPRLDPVVYPDTTPDSPFKLDAGQVNSYEKNGFLVLPGAMTDLVQPIMDEIQRLKHDLKGAEELYTEPDSDEPRTIFKPYAHSDLVDAIRRDPRILQPVQQLLGSAAYTMQSRINIKPAFAGRSFPWHSDFETWHTEDGMPAMRAVTAWIMLTENHPFNGPLYVLKGSHKKFVSCSGITGEDNFKTSLRRQTLGVPRNETMKELMDEYPLTAIYGPPGTLVFHECNILHGSPDNISSDPRGLLMFVYNSVANRPAAPFGGLKPRPHYLSDRDTNPLQPLTAPVVPDHYCTEPA